MINLEKVHGLKKQEYSSTKQLLCITCAKCKICVKQFRRAVSLGSSHYFDTFIDDKSQYVSVS